MLETINNIITVCVKLPSFSNLLCNISNIYKNNSYELLSCNFLSFNKSLLIKKYHDTSKLQELNYSFFVGKQINKLLNICSNFCATITCLHLDSSNITSNNSQPNNTIILENISGTLFSEWLKSKNFNFKDYYDIILQLSLSLFLAYEHFGFIHNDMFPWNIILVSYSTTQIIHYYYLGKMFTVKTKIKPVIIDFGNKANIIVSNHYYKFNTNAIKIQDIVTLIISSSEIITKKQQITSLKSQNLSNSSIIFLTLNIHNIKHSLISQTSNHFVFPPKI